MSSATTSGEAATCPYCGRRMPQRDFALPGRRPMLITLPCDCERARQDAEAERREAYERARSEEFRRIWGGSGIPKRFAHVGADFTHDEHLARGGGLYISGDNGRGKTTLACAVAKARVVRTIRPLENGRVTHGATLLFVPAYRMASELRSTWTRWDATERDVFGRWCGVDVLILDDLGKGKAGEWSTENVFRVVDERWANGKATIITSQYGSRQLAERMRGTESGTETLEALLSRLRGWCHHVRLDGPDRRLERTGS